MYLRLLVARHTIEKVLGESGGDTTNLTRSLASLERRVKDEALSDELRRSLEGQIEILRQRIDRRGDADRQLTFIDAELGRIEQQVELIREQAALSTDPELLSQRIDEIAATLGGTSEWIRISGRCLAPWRICCRSRRHLPGHRAKGRNNDTRPAQVGGGNARPVSIGGRGPVPDPRQCVRCRACRRPAALARGVPR